MRTHTQRLRILLLLILIFVLSACTPEPSETTGPETTVPVTTMPSETTVPPATTLPPETTAPPVGFQLPDDLLSAEEAEKYYAMLAHVPGADNWLRRATNCIYDDPSQLDLYHFFYCGFYDDGCDWETISEDLANLLMEHNFGTYADIQELPVEKMEQIMQTIFGISLSDVTGGMPDKWPYCEETDSYYSNHNDAYGTVPEFLGVRETEDGLVEIYYTTSDYLPAEDGGYEKVADTLVLTLRPVEGGYQVVSNKIAE